MAVKLFVNGVEYVTEKEDKTLLKWLREDLGLVGTKDGCSRGQCGTCTVIIDGKAVRACTRKMKMLEGKSVETIEGISDGEKLHPIQVAFLKCHAYQCGFCTPGVIMATKALLDSNPHPTDDEIKDALKFNICRCTGYQQILDAVHLAIEILDGKEVQLFGQRGWVGESPVTKNGIQRVTGQALFTDDFKLDNPLQGRVFFPEYPHANILSIDCSEALKQPGVAFIATAKDISGNNYFSSEKYPQQILADKKVRYIGDPVAIVYAETEEQAYNAMPFIKVEYEVLPVITTAMQGAKESCRIHEDTPNEFYSQHLSKGNIERGFAQSDVIIEEDISTQMIEHGCMEPDAALSELDENGRLVIYGTGQDPTKMKNDTAAALGLGLDEFRTVTRPSGGAFGSREDQMCHVFAALGTLNTKRPVRFIFSRREVHLFTPKRHPVNYHYKIGAKNDGRIMAVQANTYVDTGAYAALGDFLVDTTTTMGTGPYDVPNIDIQSHGVYTNNVVANCMRGFGSTQNTVAIETLVDRISEKTGVDPFEIRMINGLEPGRQTPSGQIIEYSCGMKDALKAIKEAIERDGIPEPSGPGKKVGFGLANGYKNMGYGRGDEDGAGAKIHLTNDGRLELLTGGVELGQGHDTVVCQIAAETLGVGYDDINIGPVDDDVSPYTTGSTSASRMTFISGNAVRTVCIKFKNTLLKYVAEKNNMSEGVLDCDSNGVFDCRKDGTFRMSFEEIGQMLAENNDVLEEEYYYVAVECFRPKEFSDNITQDGVNHRVYIAYIFSIQAAIVEVDEETGKVTVLKFYAADDCGRAINPALIEGQIIGSVVMGMGYALSENFIMEDGYVKTEQFGQLGIPKITDAPVVEPIIIEENHPFGPYGAKGLGEVALNAAAPAILNAIYDAVGVRINSTPVDQKRLAAAIKGDKIY